MKRKFCFGLFTIIVLVIGVNCREIPSNTVDDNNLENDIPIDTIKSIVLCSTDGGLTGVMNCAVSRALKILQVASKIKKIEILPGVIIEENETIDRNAKELNEDSLPKNPEEKSVKLTSIFMDRIVTFLSGRTLKIDFPTTTADNVARALEEGRGKMKKMMGPLLMGIALKLMAIIPLFLGGLAIISTKALIIAKIALLLSIIIFVQSFFSSGFRNIIRGHGFGLGHKFNTGTYGSYGPDYSYGAPGWTTTQLGNQYPYKRSIEISSQTSNDEVTAQDLAYSEQKP